jgi:hypothetical protein
MDRLVNDDYTNENGEGLDDDSHGKLNSGFLLKSLSP